MQLYILFDVFQAVTPHIVNNRGFRTKQGLFFWFSVVLPHGKPEKVAIAKGIVPIDVQLGLFDCVCVVEGKSDDDGELGDIQELHKGFSDLLVCVCQYEDVPVFRIIPHDVV